MFAIARSRVPLAELQAATSQLNRMLNDTFHGWPFPTEDSPLIGAWVPPVDIRETRDHVQIVAEVPGVKPEDVKISMENNILTIRGEKQRAVEQQDEKVHRFERSYGAFERSFSVPSSVDAERITADYDAGVLTITLPKAERAKPRTINVAVQSK
jgi:HSP20 family protein